MICQKYGASDKNFCGACGGACIPPQAPPASPARIALISVFAAAALLAAGFFAWMYFTGALLFSCITKRPYQNWRVIIKFPML